MIYTHDTMGNPPRTELDDREDVALAALKAGASIAEAAKLAGICFPRAAHLIKDPHDNYPY